MASVRFTPDEIQALIASKELTASDIQAMHPDDQKVWKAIMSTQGTSDAPPGVFDRTTEQKLGGAAMMGGGALAAAPALGVSAAIPSLSGALSGSGQMIKTGAGMYAVSKAGDLLNLPKDLTNMLMLSLGLKGSGGAKAVTGAAEGAIPGALSAAERAGLVKQGYSPEMISKIEASAAAGPQMPTARRSAPSAVPSTPSTPGTGFFSEPPSFKASPGASLKRPSSMHSNDISEIEERVKGGVQNDFKGPVSLPRRTTERPDGGNLGSQSHSIPPNLSTTRTPADVHEQVTGSSRKGYEDTHNSSALEYNTDTDVSALQKVLEEILRKK